MTSSGSIVAGRFEIERLAGRGGMGAVYRARDRATGGVAAIKILHEEAPPEHHERLAREARALADLTHPAIVRYLAFGATERGEPYLAMEWLDGEDLAARLKRSGVGREDAVRIAARVASALGAAHARGIVHRDVKPSNLFLVDAQPDRAKVLDFGIARMQASASMTRTGAAIGTPRYMAPEQARGVGDVDARADVFSLGCVLFECIAGRPAFTGANAAAVLAKIVLEDPPRLSSICPDVPPLLDELVARMMSKQVGQRPRDGAELAEELGRILEDGLGNEQQPTTVAPSTGVTTGEQRLLCVVFAARAIGEPATCSSPPSGPLGGDEHDATRAAEWRAPTISLEVATATTGLPQDLVRTLSTTVALHRARAEILADGSVVVTLLGDSAATDQAARAARCALAIRGLLPHSPMALAIGRGVIDDRIPLGEIIDRATSLVRGTGPGPIRVDAVSAGLLDVRFVIEGDDEGLVLAGERDVAAPTRTLLGKPIPCIGRERELAALEAIFAECLAEPMSHVVVVTGAAGIGKSRVRYELVQRLASRAEIWIGRGDPMSVGAPFAMLAQALRRAAGIVDDEPLATRWWKLQGRVSRHVGGEHVARVTEFLGELIGTTTDEATVQLRAARQDPQLMGDQMLQALEDFVAAECDAHPVVLVLEDLQWSDLPTIQFVDALARRLADRPLMVLALARPDVDTVFPRLWSERAVEHVRLGELTKRAAERLVRSALGDDVDGELLSRLVERAAGNAFYLEELIRSVADGYGDRLPETVVAMAQARIESLEHEARHVLRAASIFGSVFWRGGVAALLDHSTTQVHDWVDELVRRELLTVRRDSRFVGEIEYTFRHALVREAAYAMLTDRDRMVAHRLAGEWLEARANRSATPDLEAVTLAEHFLRGGELRRSVVWYQRAAELALEGDDLENAIEFGERAIACVQAVEDTTSEADRDLIGMLRQLQAGAHAWRGEYVLASERGAEAMQRLSPGTTRWLAAVAAVAVAGARRLEHAAVLELCHSLAAIPTTPDTHRAYAYAVAGTMTTLLWHGEPELIDRLFAALDRIEAVTTDPAAGAWIHIARAWRVLRNGDQAASMLLDAEAERCFAEVGDQRHACMQRANVGYGELMLGAFERAEESLRDAIALATRIGLDQVTTQAQHNLGLALARQGKIDEARRVETAALDAFVAQDNLRLAAAAHNYLALIEIAAGKPAAAIAQAHAAIDAAAGKSGTLSTYHGTLARAHLLAGDPPAALEVATVAMTIIDQHGRPEEGESALRLAHAEALHAAGRSDEARIAIATALGIVEQAAAKISDPAWRASFEGMPENAGLRALSRR